MGAGRAVKRLAVAGWASALPVWLVNPGGLWPLVVPPVAPLVFWPWIDFLWLPVLVAAIVGLSVSFMLGRQVVAAIVFWIVLLAGMEMRQRGAVAAALPSDATCVERHGVLHSLTFARQTYQFDVHAAFVAPDRVGLWSYRDMDFFTVGPGTLQNLDFGACGEAVRAFLRETRP